MTRRHFLLAGAGVALASLAGAACARGRDDLDSASGTIAARDVELSPAPDTAAPPSSGTSAPAAFEPLEKSHAAWRELLPRDRYEILFEEDTEPPFSSPLNAEKRSGTFVCAACNLPLFESGAKFNSGTGWPSFYQPIAGRTATKKDYKLLFPRTEYHCARCGGHQGHVFDDGPPPTGQRWCNNGLALVFVPDGEALPELRR